MRLVYSVAKGRGGMKRRRGGGRGLLTDAITRRIQCGSARFSKASQRILKRIPGKIHYPTFRIFENLQRSLRISKEFQKNFKRISKNLKESQRIPKESKENLKRISKESELNGEGSVQGGRGRDGQEGGVLAAAMVTAAAAAVDNRREIQRFKSQPIHQSAPSLETIVPRSTRCQPGKSIRFLARCSRIPPGSPPSSPFPLPRHRF